jgi:hypothetical protein
MRSWLGVQRWLGGALSECLSCGKYQEWRRERWAHEVIGGLLSISLGTRVLDHAESVPYLVCSGSPA